MTQLWYHDWLHIQAPSATTEQTGPESRPYPKHLPSRRFLASEFSERLEGAIQVSNQYPVCTFFSICTISPNLNGSGGSFLPQYLFLTCAQVRSSMEMLPGMCQWHSGIIYAAKYLEGNHWGWCQQLGETKMVQWKSSYQNHRMLHILHIFKDPKKIAPDSNCHVHATWGRGC